MMGLRPIQKLWILRGLLSLGVLAFGWLIVSTALEKGVAISDRIILLAIGVVALAAFWKTRPEAQSDGGEENGTDRQHWSIASIALNSLGVMASAVGFMSPRPAVESTPGLIEQLLFQVSNDAAVARENTEKLLTRELSENSYIRKSIAGIWGEPGCDVTYRITVAGDALTMESLDDEVGMTPMKFEATIAFEKNGILRTSVESGDGRGQTVDFSIRRNSMSRQLIWDPKGLEHGAQELDQCG